MKELTKIDDFDKDFGSSDNLLIQNVLISN